MYEILISQLIPRKPIITSYCGEKSERNENICQHTQACTQMFMAASFTIDTQEMEAMQMSIG